VPISVSCGKNVNSPGTSESDISSDGKTDMSSKGKNKNDPEIMKKYDVNGDGKLMVFFIGNSFTYSFDIPAKFKKIAKTQGIDLGVYVRAEPGYKLSVHLTELPDYPDYIKNADIVILQDYGGFWADTDKLIPQIQALFDKKVMFYYYPYVVPSRVYNSVEIENITFVPTGDIFNELLKEYSKDNFIANDHNNDLCSYIFANAIYSVIFNADCTDFPYKSVITTTYLQGETNEEKENNLLEYRKIVMKVINNKS
jgi:hypothetical protein